MITMMVTMMATKVTTPAATTTGARCFVVRGARRAALALWLAGLALGGGAACGNYSNEDLEFMSAIPVASDLSVEQPARAAILIGDVAEGAKTTFQTTRTLNATAAAFLGLVDAVRAYSPTSRATNQRTWGPFPDDKNPGWRWIFEMTKNVDVSPVRFEYTLSLIPPSGVALSGGGASSVVIGGYFEAAGSARLGVGQLELTPTEARTAGATFGDLDTLDELSIKYDTRGPSRQVTMFIQNVPPADPTASATSATYDYALDEAGVGTMTFVVVQDIVPGPLGLETLSIKSRWYATAEGRWDVAITGGDSAGATLVECWNERLASTYRLPSWTNLTGDPATCIPAAP